MHTFFSSTSITTCLTLQLHARSETLPRKHLDMKKISHSSHLCERTPRNEQLTRPFQSPETKQCWKRRLDACFQESDLIDNTNCELQAHDELRQLRSYFWASPSPAAMHCPSGSSGLAIPDGYVLPFSPKGLFFPTGLFSPFSPTGLFSLFSPFSRGERKEATKAEHTARDEAPPANRTRSSLSNI